MTRRQPADRWPPDDGQEFVRSHAFGQMLLDVVEQLDRRYPHMDFTDAVAHVFAWFDAKLLADPRFINAQRFRAETAFRAYLRQAAWNAARLAERQRQRRRQIAALPVDHPIADRELSPHERADLLERVEGLPEPHKTVFWRLFFEEADLPMIASALNLTEGQVCEVYEEGIDRLDLF